MAKRNAYELLADLLGSGKSKRKRALESARKRRVAKYLKDHPETRLVAVSGTGTPPDAGLELAKQIAYCAGGPAIYPEVIKKQLKRDQTLLRVSLLVGEREKALVRACQLLVAAGRGALGWKATARAFMDELIADTTMPCLVCGGPRVTKKLRSGKEVTICEDFCLRREW